ncbi:hypothetical protein G6F42_029084 [Rhizopus arrhizus]|nr:hypothetical protein G6F42_029084 [Rhizopus arrhizus]
MVYSEIDLMTLGGDEDDAHIADDEQDIKPRFHKANVVENELTTKEDEAANADKKKSGLLDDDDSDVDDDEDDDDYDDFEDDEFYGEWNLRKLFTS